MDYIELSNINKKIKEIKRRGYISDDDAHIVNKLIHRSVLWDPEKIFYSYKKELKQYLKQARSFVKSFLWSKVESFHKVADWPGGGGIYTAIKRKNYIWVNMLIAIHLKLYLKCLYALNTVYYHEFLTKWSFKKIKDFKHKPKNCVKRLEKISILGNKDKELKEKLRIFSSLIKDTAPLMKKL